MGASCLRNTEAVVGGARSLRCPTCGNGLVMRVPAHRCRLRFIPRSARCPPKPTQTPRRNATCRMPPSALSSSESLPARSFLDPSNCGAFSRSSSNNAWPGRGLRSKNRSSPTSCTGRERTLMAAPIRWFGSTPGGSATNCASTYEGRSDPVVISLPKGSYVPVFEANSASPLIRLSRCSPGAARAASVQESQARENGRRRSSAHRAVVAARFHGVHSAGRRTFPPSCSPWPRTRVWRGRRRCPRTATLSPSPGRATPRLARRISM